MNPFSRQAQAYWRMSLNNQLPYVKVDHRAEVGKFEVDLCLSLFQKRSGADAPVDELLERGVQTHLCGATAWALALEDQLLDLCTHLAARLHDEAVRPAPVGRGRRGHIGTDGLRAHDDDSGGANPMMHDGWPGQFEKILRAHLPLLPDGQPLEPSIALADLGLDSLGTVALLVELEESFAAAVPDDKLTQESFATPANLWSVLAASIQ